jgi:two-component system, NarL family, sensor histidine kinase UhpB
MLRPFASGGDLKRSLLVRITLVALACLIAVAVLSALETRREEEARAVATAEIIGKHLELQLWRISAGVDIASRYPDWDALLINLPLTGQCVELLGREGEIVRNQCTGAAPLDVAAPVWFAEAWGLLLGHGAQAKRALTSNGESRGTVVVTTDERVVVHQAWRQLQQFLALTALIVFAISVLSVLTVAKALAPASVLLDGLERMKSGAFATRLPPFRLRELDRIGKAANALAAKIETTLAERAELSRRLINAQEDERRSLAGELHDEFGQNLTAIAALAASIEKTTDGAEPGVAGEARTIGKIAGEMLSALRGTLRQLKPAELESFGLSQGLQQLVDLWNASQHTGTLYKLDMPRDVSSLAPTTAMHIFRIAQEGLTNATRHAQARNVRLSLEEVPTSAPRGEAAPGVHLTIEDDGKGARGEVQSSASGMGLLNMRERVAALGGTIALEDVHGGGLRVRIVIPAVSGWESRP